MSYLLGVDDEVPSKFDYIYETFQDNESAISCLKVTQRVEIWIAVWDTFSPIKKKKTNEKKNTKKMSPGSDELSFL